MLVSKPKKVIKILENIEICQNILNDDGIKSVFGYQQQFRNNSQTSLWVRYVFLRTHHVTLLKGFDVQHVVCV